MCPLPLQLQLQLQTVANKAIQPCVQMQMTCQLAHGDIMQMSDLATCPLRCPSLTLSTMSMRESSYAHHVCPRLAEQGKVDHASWEAHRCSPRLPLLQGASASSDYSWAKPPNTCRMQRKNLQELKAYKNSSISFHLDLTFTHENADPPTV